MGKLILTESQLINLIRKALISEQKDVTDLKTYPACVQKFGNPTSTTSGKEYSIRGWGYFKNYDFYNNGRVSKPDSKMASYSCEGDTILIDGQKNVQDPNTYPSCVTKAFGKELLQSSKGGYYIQGTGNFQDYMFYNNMKTFNTKDNVLYNYSCGAGGIIIGQKADAATSVVAGATAALGPDLKSCASKETGFASRGTTWWSITPFGQGELRGFNNGTEVWFVPKGASDATHKANARCKDNVLEVDAWTAK